MVFLEGITAGALVPLQGQPELQSRLVWLMIITVLAVTIVVIILIIRFAFWHPGLLFNPSDIHSSAHVDLYAPNATVPQKPQQPASAVEFRVTEESGDKQETESNQS
ncbi:MAG: hypothetical protein EXR50_07925 [Dehalococcoidia bacterium]|nr:hypothetical protein [Dehalococcoidia bacterium]